MADGLTIKQERFVEEYLIDFNGARAIRRAGYSSRNANKAAYLLLRRPEVMAAVDKARAAMRERAQMKADEVLSELARIGRANIGTYLPAIEQGNLSLLTEDQTAAISEVVVDTFREGKGDDARDVRRVKVKMHDKRAALVDIGRHLGVFQPPDRSSDADEAGAQELPSKDKLVHALVNLLEGARPKLPQSIDVTPADRGAPEMVGHPKE